MTLHGECACILRMLLPRSWENSVIRAQHLAPQPLSLPLAAPAVTMTVLACSLLHIQNEILQVLPLLLLLLLLLLLPSLLHVSHRFSQTMRLIHSLLLKAIPKL